MNVTSIRLQGLYTVDLPLYVARPSDPYLIKAADGLGPPRYEVFISGRFFQGRVPQNRELIFRIGLTPDYRQNQTAADLRDQLYGLLMPETADGSVPIHFMNGDTILASTVGWVSDIDPALFTKEPEVNLTFPCTEPYLHAPNTIDIVPPTKDAFTIVNAGTAPTGIEVELTFTAPVTNWILDFGATRMMFEHNFLTGDVLRFNTLEDRRFVTLIRGGVETGIISALSADSEWIVLHGGENHFLTSDQSFVWKRIRYQPLYQGV